LENKNLKGGGAVVFGFETQKTWVGKQTMGGVSNETLPGDERGNGQKKNRECEEGKKKGHGAWNLQRGTRRKNGEV